MAIIDGKKWARVHQEKLAEKIAKLVQKPILVSILVGDDPASVLYTSMKQKKAQKLGIEFRIAKYPTDTSFELVSTDLQRFNQDPQITGLMIQLPSLPGLIELISPEKDVDGLLEDSPYQSATVRAVINLLRDEQIDLSDKKVVIVGAKGEVGRGLMRFLKAKEIIGLDKETTDLAPITGTADVLISATGVPSLIKGEMVKEGSVVIDVGISQVNGQVAGDIDSDSVSSKAAKLSPVPGGVGPMTVICLMENVVEAALKQN